VRKFKQLHAVLWASQARSIAFFDSKSSDPTENTGDRNEDRISTGPELPLLLVFQQRRGGFYSNKTMFCLRANANPGRCPREKFVDTFHMHQYYVPMHFYIEDFSSPVNVTYNRGFHRWPEKHVLRMHRLVYQKNLNRESVIIQHMRPLCKIRKYGKAREFPPPP